MQYNTLARKFDIIKKFEGTVAYKYVDACSYTSSSSTEGIAVTMRTTCFEESFTYVSLKSKSKKGTKTFGKQSSSSSPLSQKCRSFSLSPSLLDRENLQDMKTSACSGICHVNTLPEKHWPFLFVVSTGILLFILN